MGPLISLLTVRGIVMSPSFQQFLLSDFNVSNPSPQNKSSITHGSRTDLNKIIYVMDVDIEDKSLTLRTQSYFTVKFSVLLLLVVVVVLRYSYTLSNILFWGKYPNLGKVPPGNSVRLSRVFMIETLFWFFRVDVL